ncbi:DUF7117 family protein [Haloparvum sedimenti]|uniref:DUF7117 family protein n=1 Tax=Haloparvum sedimenti TaxID=1678448 RepID=UPI00071E734A|nr:hypothetical protein [Haloparvum sedimenti]
MKVRGERECKECGARWSYYETGDTACPECGSLRSVGVGDRALHTDAPAELDLAPHRERFGDAAGTLPVEGVSDLKRDLREYLSRRGFVRGGDLLPLDEGVLAARELLQAVDVYDRLRDPTDDDRTYLLELLSNADDGERPDPEDVPPNMHAARGLAVANAVAAYRDDLRTYLDEYPDAEARDALGSLRDRINRVESLQGDVEPRDAEVLVRAANEVGEYLQENDEGALADARARLSDLEL